MVRLRLKQMKSAQLLSGRNGTWFQVPCTPKAPFRMEITVASPWDRTRVASHCAPLCVHLDRPKIHEHARPFENSSWITHMRKDRSISRVSWVSHCSSLNFNWMHIFPFSSFAKCQGLTSTSHAFQGGKCTVAQHINKARECFPRSPFHGKASSAALLRVSLRLCKWEWAHGRYPAATRWMIFGFSLLLQHQRGYVCSLRAILLLLQFLSFLSIQPACLSLRFELKADTDGQLCGSELVLTVFLHVFICSFIHLLYRECLLLLGIVPLQMEG